MTGFDLALAPTMRASFLTDFTEQGGDEFVVPTDLAGLSDEDLARLHEQAGEYFDTLYGDGQGLTADEMETLRNLTESLERINAEVDAREAAAAERAQEAAQLAARVRPQQQQQADGPDTEDGGGDGEEEAGDGEETGTETVTPDSDPSQPETTETAPEQERELVTASTAPTRVPMSRIRSRAARRPPVSPAPETYNRLQDIMHASVDGSSFTAGQGIGWDQAAGIVDRHLAGFKPGMYEAAARSGRHVSQTFPVATLTRPKPPELVLSTNDPFDVERVINTAIDEARTPQGSLTASGGWCAPSETYYDLTEMEGREGLLSLPEIRVTRGGFKRTLGPDFADLFGLGEGFVYTEAQDIAGTYGVDEFGIGNGAAGTKPCVRVPCTDWEEFRLGVDGLCITAGLLMQKGYPELIARTIRGILVAHDHIQSGRYIRRLVDGSDAVTMPAPAGGAIAPLLDAIELQAQHMRSIRRIPAGTTLEAKFPMWTHGMIRSDLSKRTGLDVLSITDAQINAWFTSKRIAPQFLYNWQDITGTAANFTQWPTEVTFLMYPAGTWVKGGDDVINVSNLMDSTLLGQNDYVALFTEESWLVAKMGFDSRVITVPVCANGATSLPVAFDCPTPPTTTTTTTAA